jgi:prevent-host-death family protein
MPKKKDQVMTKNVPAFIARTQFGQILERVSQNNERFVVTKKGEAKAIILGVEDFLRATAEIPESLATLQGQAQKSGANRLTLEEIEEEIDAVRRIKAPDKNKEKV